MSPWLHVVLVHPDIPQNAGNIIRLCANTGARLHLVEPLGFLWDDKHLRRAHVHYDEWADVLRHESWTAAIQALSGSQLWAIETGGGIGLGDAEFAIGDTLVFGSESRGLPHPIRESIGHDHTVTLPMRPNSRSINLANVVAIAVYRAWEQSGWIGAASAQEISL